MGDVASSVLARLKNKAKRKWQELSAVSANVLSGGIFKET